MELQVMVVVEVLVVREIVERPEVRVVLVLLVA
jgi:hypothetical protein